MVTELKKELNFLRDYGTHVEVPRRFLREFLDAVTSRPQYFFSADFLTRRARKNADGTVRPAGSQRHLVCKKKPNINSTKNWESKGGTLRFDPVKHDLYHVYTTEGANGDDGEGNHWGFICLRSCYQLQIQGVTYKVIE